jgi:hypothetical protein
MDVGAPAVIAAIADATGVWITDLPASPERILAALAGVPAAAPLPPGASELAASVPPAPGMGQPAPSQLPGSAR